MKNRKFSLSILVFAIAFNVFAETRMEKSIDEVPPLIVAHTNKSMQEVLADLKVAITNNNYRFIRQQNIDNRLTDSAAENGQVVLVYFCNFSMLNQALQMDGRVGVFLPCKITLIQKHGYVVLVAVNPKFIGNSLNQESLNDICDQLTRDYGLILQDAII